MPLAEPSDIILVVCVTDVALHQGGRDVLQRVAAGEVRSSAYHRL